jgi:uncharacterized SAM-binding protein YcdF (DUF218 family)
LEKKKYAFLRWLLPLPFGLLAIPCYLVPGFDFSGLVFLCLAGVVLCWLLIEKLKQYDPGTGKAVMICFNTLLGWGISLVLCTALVIVGASGGNPDVKCDYIVVLGAQVRQDGPSWSLQSRIDTACEYLTAHPNVIAVVSGGQGDDEPISEAQCMYDRLVARGIEPERLWIESKATSTWENLKFSLELIEERAGVQPLKIGLISSEYHLFRAGLQAKEFGITIAGIPARTDWVALRLNYYLRETAGVWHYILLGGPQQ